MSEILGLPLALFLVIAGLVVFVASWFIHALLLLLAVLLVVAGIYFFVTGGPAMI
jgi:NADH:ubiquinone oxidoreductase subunit 6 (subunit J)